MSSSPAVVRVGDRPQEREWVRPFRRALRSWFRIHARDLPWRRTRDPYAVWISEIMLQQTQVATVIPYFQRFLAAFPDVESLARADEELVLRFWEGLGYYRRARQLHAAARVVMQQHAGAMPASLEVLKSLPGIGRYTAGAIASIAFGRSAPILEANTIRLWSRLAGIRDDVTRASTQQRLWRLAEAVLGGPHPGEINQALMEIGSQVCTPQNPRCGVCPLQGWCVARAENRQLEIPATLKKTTYEEVREVAVVIRRRGMVLLRKCGAGERWAGLWDFPRFRLAGTDAVADLGDLARQCRQLTGVQVSVQERVTTIRHGVTRYRITLDCYLARYCRGVGDRSATRWVQLDELEALPLSVTGRRLARLLN